MKKKAASRIIAFMLFLLFSGAVAAAEKIVVAGSGDSQDLLRAAAAAFQKANPGTRIEIPRSIGSSGGIRAVERGDANLGRIARLVTTKDKKFNLGHIVFAYSPVVFFCNESVKKVENLTYRQIVDIYSGRITSWSQLGGENAPIYIANREEGDSSREVLEDTVPGFRDIPAFAGQIIRSTPENIDIVEKYKGTVGYGPLSMVKGRRLKILKVEGVFPSIQNVHNGKYSLITPFSFVWKGRLSGVSRRFVDFIFSPEGQKIIAEHGSSPVTKPRE